MKFHGMEFFPEDGPIIAINHASNYDPIILGSIIKRKIHFLAKKELYSYSGSNWFFSKLHAIPVDRRSGNVIKAVRCCLRAINNGEVLGIFPEGKRCNNGEIVQPKKGVAFFAMKTGASVIPVAITGVSKGLRNTVKVNGVSDYSYISQMIMNKIRTLMEM
jgi:1-acyl-sn-glycerol-3-phosphate acyltransferase